MKLSQFKFKLTEEQIAKYPAKNRDESRLMVVHRNIVYSKIYLNILTIKMFLFLTIQKSFRQDYMGIKKRQVRRSKYFCCVN